MLRFKLLGPGIRASLPHSLVFRGLTKLGTSSYIPLDCAALSLVYSENLVALGDSVLAGDPC